MEAMEMPEHIKKLEEQLLNANTRNSRKELEKLIAADFLEFGSSGRVWNKKDIITDLLNENTEGEYSLSTEDFKVISLSSDVAMATYRCYRKNLSGDILRTTLRSSIWRLKEGNWQLYFHQGTVVDSNH